MNIMNKRAWAGFTVIEIIIVVVGLAILATLGITSYVGLQNRAYDVAILSDAEAIQAAVENKAQRNAGLLELDAYGEGYHYSEANANDPIIKALNADIGFTPTKGNVVDVKTTDDGKEFCVRVYNTKARVYNSAFNAFQKSSSNNVALSGTDSCEYEEGTEPTVYSGGAIPGAYETLFSTPGSGTYTVPASAERLEVALIGAGGNGNALCGGGGGGLYVAVIPVTGGQTFNYTVGGPSPAGTSGGNGGSSTFGSYTATGGANPLAGCSAAAAAGGTGGTTGTSQKYGSGGTGGVGGYYLLTIGQAPTGTVTGGGGYGANVLTAGAGGANATFGGGGGGGGGKTALLVCLGFGAAGNAGGGGAGQPGSNCNIGHGGLGGRGSGGGGRGGNVAGANPGLGGNGQVRVLTCFEDTCNPIPTPVP